MRAIFRNLVVALFGAVLSLGFYGQEAEAVLKGSSAATGVSSITSGTVGLDDGLVGTPSLYRAASTNTGLYFGSGTVNWTISGAAQSTAVSGAFRLRNNVVLGWTPAAPDAASADTGIARVSANSILFGAGSAATTTSRTELNKAVTTISNAVATSVLTITIPNAAHSGTVMVRLTCSLGAGGVIGANEATASNSYMVSITRTAGVNATAAISAAYGAAATAVAGASTVTATAALAAVGGAVGATNTIDVQATVSRSASTSDNHTCLVYGQLMNANVTGITIS